MAVQNPQAAFDELNYRLSNIETKARLNEQNFFNMHERVELLSRNFLDLKKELLGRVDNLTQEAHEFGREISDLKRKISSLEGKMAVLPKAAAFAPEKAVSHEMSSADAGKTLDEVMKKLGG